MAAYSQSRRQKTGGGRRFNKKRIYHRRKVCRFCADTSLEIDYKI